jgi:hypothetical protein
MTYFLPFCLALAATAAAAPLVNFSDTWHYRKGNAAPQAGWKTITDASLDAQWLTGPGWIGFGDGSAANNNAAGTTLSDMRQVSGGAAGYRTFYIRKTFTVGSTLPGTDDVFLSVDFDDGFVAFLDGVFIDQFGNPTTPNTTEPAYNYTGTTADHECSFGNGTVNPVRVTNIGKVAAKLAPGTHVLAIMCLNNSITSSDAVMKADLYTQAAAPPLDFHWQLSESPIVLGATFVVPATETLTIDPGVEVRCHGGSDAIDCAGRIQALGTASQPIRFVRSSAGTGWNRIRLTGPQDSTFRYCDFDGASTSGTIRGGGTASAPTSVVLENCRFLNTEVQMVDLTYCSCRIVNCEFDSIGAQELLHFSNMPSNGRALIKGCRFGLPGTPPTSGYNDIIDFTGGNRPGPIAEFIDNVFLSSVDDCFDMDGTDAHIEGNVFINVRKDAARSSSSNPITTGSNGSDLSELVICRNTFYDCEHAFMEKDRGTAVMQNNTVVKVRQNSLSNNTNAGGNEGAGIIMFGEPWRGFPYGDGVIFQGNIASEIEAAITDPWPVLAGASAEVGFFFPRSYNCIQRFLQPGIGNVDADPLFVSTTGVDYSNILAKLSLQPGSPCKGTGPNGIDMGSRVPSGASISGEPPSITSQRNATLEVAGPGIWAYRWRLNGAAWSSEVSFVPAGIWAGQPFTGTMLDTRPPISLTNLADGTYTVEVQGKNSAGSWQDTPTVSKTWTVQNLPADTDGDGLPDAWETANGLNPNSAADAQLDKDGDGASNFSEYTAGTSPQNPNDVLRASSTQNANGTVTVAFPAVAGKSYRLQVSTDLLAPGWNTLQTFAPAASNGVLTYVDSEVPIRNRRFYRVLTP